MKKIFNLILAALVIIGAAACTKSEEIVDQTQQGEGLSFYAEIVNGDTRAYIDDTDGDKVWNTIWEEGDAVYVGADDADPYIFTYTNGKFTCSEEGVTSLIGQSVTVGPYQVNDDSTVGKSAWSFTGTRVENFDADVKVQLTADTSFFRYTYNGTGEVTITVAPANKVTKVFRYCEEEDVLDYFSSITLKGAATDKFVGFWPQTLSGLEATLSYSINGVKCKETSITLATGKVYNLGTLTEPVASKVWGTAGTHNDWAAGNPASMYEKGDYVVAYNLAGGTQFKFVKLGAGNGGWDGAVGGTYGTNEAPTVSEANTWHSCGETNILLPSTGAYDVYYLPTSMKYNVVAAGSTPEEYVAPKVALSLSGTFNNWGDTDLVEQNGIYVAKSVKFDAYASFKVRKDKAWTENYGGGIVYMNPNYHIQTYSDGSDISITAAGTYDVYFNYDSKLLYVVTAGRNYTSAPLQTAEGKEPENEEVEVTENKLYLKPNANWKKDGARFAAYFFGSGDKWVSMTDTDKDGIYEVNIPEGYDYGCNVIFCRMNPATTANNWNNKWNQTSDLKAPTDGKNLYTVKENTWDKGGGTWSVK